MSTTPTLRDAAQAVVDADDAHCLDQRRIDILRAALAAPTDALAEPVAYLSTDSIGERYLCFSRPTDNDRVESLHTATQLQQAVAREREECAVICERAVDSIWEYHEDNHKRTGHNVCTNLAALIRAKGTHD